MELFDFKHNRVYEDEIEFNTLITKFESGKEQRRSKSPPRRRFMLEFGKEEVDADEMYSFFKRKKGRFEAFKWEHPRTGEEITVRFDEDVMSRTSFMDIVFEYGLTLVEVL